MVQFTALGLPKRQASDGKHLSDAGRGGDSKQFRDFRTFVAECGACRAREAPRGQGTARRQSDVTSAARAACSASVVSDAFGWTGRTS